MNYNLKQLELWYEDIRSYERLSLKEVKILIRKIDDNPKNRCEIRNKIICGTLYVVYEQIKKSNLIHINPQLVDINDIINSACELWIEIIDNKKNLEVNTFHQLFGLQFYNSLSKSLNIQNETFDLNQIYFEMLQWFIIENQNKEILYKDFLKELDKRYSHNYSWHLENLHKTKLFNLLKESYCFLKKDTTLLTSDKNISIRQLKFIKSFIIENIKNSKINLNEIPTEDNMEHILELILHKQFNNFVFNGTILTDIEKDVIYHIYGFDGKIFTRREFARKIDKSTTRVSQIEQKALRKLRRNLEIKKLTTKGEYHG